MMPSTHTPTVVPAATTEDEKSEPQNRSEPSTVRKFWTYHGFGQPAGSALMSAFERKPFSQTYSTGTTETTTIR